MKNHTWRDVINLTVIVGALGYFVDIFDLILFPIVRNRSLADLGVPAAQILPTFLHLFNYQMTGMLVGGILWGILGDKKGRMSVLFGSITLYSLANIANAFVTTIPAYARRCAAMARPWWRAWGSPAPWWPTSWATSWAGGEPSSPAA